MAFRNFFGTKMTKGIALKSVACFASLLLNKDMSSQYIEVKQHVNSL